MKFLFAIFVFPLSWVDAYTQDIIKNLQVPQRYANKLSVTRKVSTEDAITAEIHVLLDSLANIGKGTILYMSKVRGEIEHILHPYWRGGALRGRHRSHAYFIRTGFQTMTHTDVQNGRLLVTVGIAPDKPAEFQLLQFEHIVKTKKLVVDY